MKQTRSRKKQTETAAVKDGFDYQRLYPYLLLVLGTFLLYGWTYTFYGGLDDEYIYAPLNNVENNFGGLLKVFTLWYSGLDYRPVTMCTFWLQRFVLGDIQPGPSHLINVGIYAILLVVLYRFIRTGRFYADTHKLSMFALLTALFFLVHPNHVSVVANVKSRDNLLSMLFGLLAVIQFLKAYDSRQWWRLLLFAVLLMMAILSKLDSYIFIFLPVMMLMFFRKSNVLRYLLIILLSLFLYSLVMSLRDNLMGALLDTKDKLNVGIDSSENPLINHFTIPNRISMACITLLYYVKFLVVPVGYYYYFGYNQIPLNPLLHPLNFFAVLLFLALLAAAVYLYKKNRIYLFSLLFFLLAIAYASNFVFPVAGIVMDRYNFIPSLGFCMALAALFLDITGNAGFSLLANRFVLALIVFFAGFTVYRTSGWKDELTLYERDIVHLDRSFHANRIIAAIYVNRGLTEEMKPDMNRKVADEYMLKGEKYVDRALAIHDSTPPVWITKGIIELYFKRYDNAIIKLHGCLSLDTADFTAMNYMGVAYMFKNNFDSAYYYYRKSMETENTFGYGAKNLMYLLNNYNRPQQADSILHVLYDRFPDNLELKRRMMETANAPPEKSILFK